MTVTLTPNLPDPDAIFAALIAAHENLDEAASRALDARLVLILVNHIGDPAIILEALRLAQEPA